MVNLATGDIEHRLIIEGVVEELYDVAVLPGLIRPSVVGFRTDEIRFMVWPAHEANGQKIRASNSQPPVYRT